MRFLLNQNTRRLISKNTIDISKQKYVNRNSLRVLSLPSMQKKYFSDSSSGNNNNKDKNANTESETNENNNKTTEKQENKTKDVVFGGDFEDFDGKCNIIPKIQFIISLFYSILHNIIYIYKLIIILFF